ncbi:MAG TPA: hypothetical protein V6D48_24890 [Oculatellaceae cyanobacterium]
MWYSSCLEKTAIASCQCHLSEGAIAQRCCLQQIAHRSSTSTQPTRSALSKAVGNRVPFYPLSKERSRPILTQRFLL